MFHQVRGLKQHTNGLRAYSRSLCLRTPREWLAEHGHHPPFGFVEPREAGEDDSEDHEWGVYVREDMVADEVDTDYMAIEVRANLGRDPKALELQMRRSLSGERVTTGR